MEANDASQVYSGLIFFKNLVASATVPILGDRVNKGDDDKFIDIQSSTRNVFEHLNSRAGSIKLLR